MYELRFTPHSVVRAVNDNEAKVKITLNYPKQVKPVFAELKDATADDFAD